MLLLSEMLLGAIEDASVWWGTQDPRSPEMVPELVLADTDVAVLSSEVEDDRSRDSVTKSESSTPACATSCLRRSARSLRRKAVASVPPAIVLAASNESSVTGSEERFKMSDD